MKTQRTTQNQNSAPTTTKRLMLAAALCLSSLAALAQGVNPTPGVLLPNSTPYGRTYAQWSEAWFLWCFSLPVTHHPIFDTADVSAGQSGHVWFLGGNFTGTPVTRNVIIPPGTALFIIVLGNWADNTDCDGSGQRISDGNTEGF